MVFALPSTLKKHMKSHDKSMSMVTVAMHIVTHYYGLNISLLKFDEKIFHFYCYQIRKAPVLIYVVGILSICYLHS